MSETNTPSESGTEDKLDPAKVIENQARESILAGNGNPELLLPHVVSKLAWRKSDDGITIFSDQAEGMEASTAIVAELKANPAYRGAFDQASEPNSSETDSSEADSSETGGVAPAEESSQAASDQSSAELSNSKQGSGAASSQPFTPASVDAHNPLAVGYALKEIASGQVRVNFEG